MLRLVASSSRVVAVLDVPVGPLVAQEDGLSVQSSESVCQPVQLMLDANFADAANIAGSANTADAADTADAANTADPANIADAANTADDAIIADAAYTADVANQSWWTSWVVAEDAASIADAADAADRSPLIPWIVWSLTIVEVRPHRSRHGSWRSLRSVLFEVATAPVSPGPVGSFITSLVGWIFHCSQRTWLREDPHLVSIVLSRSSTVSVRRWSRLCRLFSLSSSSLYRVMSSCAISFFSFCDHRLLSDIDGLVSLMQLCHLRLPSGYRDCELSAFDDEVVVNRHSLPSEDRLRPCDLTIVGKIVGKIVDRGHRLIVRYLDLM
jgi:hypothetical protein